MFQGFHGVFTALAATALLGAAGSLPVQAQVSVPLQMHGASTMTVLRNANGYTLLGAKEAGGANGERQLRQFSSLAFDAHGKIVALGNAEQVKLAIGEQHANARLIDMQGRTVLPGLIDAHGHVFGLGEEVNALQLRDSADLPQALQRIKAYAAQQPAAQWIVGGGWNQVVWKLGRFPTAQELDAVTGDKPAWLVRVDGHAAWANSRALHLAGISAATPDPTGGKIERLPNGAPSGVLVDKAMELVARLVPDSNEAQLRAALDASLRELSSVGLTSVHDAGLGPQQDKLLREYASAGKLNPRVYGMIRGAQFARFQAATPLIGMADDHYSLRAVKLFADGALGSRGAALLAPYADRPDSRGLLFMSDAALQAQMKQLVAAGYQVNLHAIGDLANRQALDAQEKIQAILPASRALRHRIEHAQVIALEDMARFARLGVIASVQPSHATSDMNMAQDRVGPQRIAGAYAWRRLRLAGAQLACGSDFPVEAPNPFWGIHAAVTRQDMQGLPPGGWYAAEAMSVKEALACFTLDAAYAAHQEQQLGSLEAGKWADFIVIDQDLFKISPYEIYKIRVLQTWVGGRQVFQRE